MTIAIDDQFINLIEPDRPWFRAPPEFFVTLVSRISGRSRV
jgi:hypothetical protein